MLSGARNWSSSAGQTFSVEPSPERCHSPPTLSGELTELEKLAILVRKIVERRARLSAEDIQLQDEITRPKGGVDLRFNNTLPRGRSTKHPIFLENSSTSPEECSAAVKLVLTPRMRHNYGTTTLGSEHVGLIHRTWPRNLNIDAVEHFQTVENAGSNVTNNRNENLSAGSMRHESQLLPSTRLQTLSEIDVEHETSNAASKQETELHRPSIVHIQVTKRPRFNVSKQEACSNFRTQNSTERPVLDTSSCSAPKYQQTVNAYSSLPQTGRHFYVNLNTGLTTESEDTGKENLDLNNNNTVSGISAVCREDRSGDPIAVSANLVITYPFVSRADSIDNPYRRMICNPAVVYSPTHSPLRRTLSQDSRRKGEGKTCKQSPSGGSVPISTHVVHTKPPIHRTNSCLAALGHTCLPISKRPKVSASNHGRSWYDGV